MSYLTFACGFAVGFIVALVVMAVAVIQSERADELRDEQ